MGECWCCLLELSPDVPPGFGDGCLVAGLSLVKMTTSSRVLRRHT